MHSSHHTAPIDAGTIENPVTKTPRQDHPKGTHNTGRQAYRGRPQPQEEQKTHTTARQTEPTLLILAFTLDPMYPPSYTPHLEASPHTTEQLPQANQSQQPHQETTHPQADT